MLFSRTFATGISLDEIFPALSANHPLRLVRIFLSVLLLFAVPGAAMERQEELPHLIGSETL